MHQLPSANRRLVPPLSALVAFEAAARHGSFTRAADELSLTQSAISRRVNMLEELLGLQLFNRIRNNVTLTPVGIFYADRIQSALKSLATATQEATLFLGRGGLLRLGLPPTLATRWLIPRIGLFLQSHRDIDVVFSTCLPGDVDFTRDDLDAIIHCGKTEIPGARSDKLLKERFIVVAHPELASTLPDPGSLVSMTLLVHARGPEAWSHWLEAQGLERSTTQGLLSFGLFSMVVEAAVDKLGVALVPEMLVEHELANRQLVRLFDSAADIHAQSVYLAYPLTKESHAPVQSFRKWLIEKCREDAANRLNPALEAIQASVSV